LPDPAVARPRARTLGGVLLACGSLLTALAFVFGGIGGAPRARADSPLLPTAPSASASPLLGIVPPPLAFGRPPELAHFFEGLDALERHARADSVRIVWLGDSHTAADFLTGTLRSALAQRYGAGGPGFLRVGVPVRHDFATLGRSGRFRIEPEPPARRSQQGDGVFGLGGMRATPLSDAARMTIKLAPQALRGRARYTVLFDFKQPGEFTLELGSSLVHVRSTADAERASGSPILRRRLEGDATDTLTLEVRRGKPRFYGVIAEGSEPGVVLDTLGIDGARIATALAWAEAPFIAEVTARKPDLVVVAFGTNEAFDELRVSAYDAQLRALVGRMRQASQADCLVLGPPDALAPGGEPEVRVAEISRVYAATARALGCAFVSAQALMGGAGGFQRWLHQDPPLSRPDRIHLTPKGYRRLGELLFASLLGEPADKNSP
jgi:lysophospholipase L1-like esterase